jgi:hypothetical protein
MLAAKLAVEQGYFDRLPPLPKYPSSQEISAKLVDLDDYSISFHEDLIYSTLDYTSELLVSWTVTADRGCIA